LGKTCSPLRGIYTCDHAVNIDEVGGNGDLKKMEKISMRMHCRDLSGNFRFFSLFNGNAALGCFFNFFPLKIDKMSMPLQPANFTIKELTV
jgi:hypothetical protein